MTYVKPKLPVTRQLVNLLAGILFCKEHTTPLLMKFVWAGAELLGSGAELNIPRSSRRLGKNSPVPLRCSTIDNTFKPRILFSMEKYVILLMATYV
jgi:hypothetical protein